MFPTTNEELLNYYSGLAMQKILTVKPTKNGIAVECNIQAAWDISDSMLKEKQRRETAKQIDPTQKN